MNGVIFWAVVGSLSFGISLVFYSVRGRDWPGFREWWDGEGIGIFMLACAALAILGLVRNRIP